MGNPSKSVPTTLTITLGQYCALPLTTMQRKRTVSVARALRAQIAQFEEAFILVHGHAPKNSAERAPLFDTYRLYRKEKRAVRTNAACRIQALCRGMQVRLMLTRNEDQQISQFVSKRAKGRVERSSSQASMMCEYAFTSQDLVSLKAEKAQVHKMLRSYEQQFFKQHKRQVSSFADIRPMASQYRRYKEIKKKLVAPKGAVSLPPPPLTSRSFNSDLLNTHAKHSLEKMDSSFKTCEYEINNGGVAESTQSNSSEKMNTSSGVREVEMTTLQQIVRSDENDFFRQYGL